MAIKKIVPLAILIIALVLFFALELHRHINLQQLNLYQQQLYDWRDQYYALTVIVFMLIYIVATAISIPGAIILTLSGGFLFGLWLGTCYVVISATIGASIIFLASKTAFADMLSRKAGNTIKKLKQGFQNNALSYLLFLRLVPIFPFWLINIVPGLLNVPLRTFLIATFIGIIPGSFVYVSVGNGLSAVFARNETPDLSIIFHANILIPIIGLAILSLLPIVYKKIRQKKRTASHD
ncbi:MAG: TVP38/TMEM64 family protein [Pseudomonadota bacterium]